MATYKAYSDFTAEGEDIARRRKMAEMLQSQALEPIKQETAGGMVVPISWTQGLAKALQGGFGAYQQGKLREESRELSSSRAKALAEALGGMPTGSPAAPEQRISEDGEQMIMPPQAAQQPTMQDNSAWMARLAQIDPQAVQIGGSMLGMQQKAQENDENRALRADMGKQARDAAMLQLQLKLADSRTTAQDKNELTRQLAEMQDESRRAIAEQGNQTRLGVAQMAANARLGRAGAGKAPMGYRFSSDGETLEPIPGGPKDSSQSKPLPTAALKLEQAERDAIGTAASISSDLAAMDKLIADKKLDLGPISNIVQQGRNQLGLSTEQSRNFNTFQTTLERLRNDSLRLNKGVQTEGDAQRAWNELMGSIRDPAVVRQRLAEIQQINDRAANLRRLNIDAIRANYGNPPADLSGYQNQNPAVGGGATGGWGIRPIP